MSDKLSNNKKLIICAVSMIAVIVALVIVIVLINKDKSSEPENGVTEKTEDNNLVTATEDNKSEKKDTEGDDVIPSPTAVVTESNTEKADDKKEDEGIKVVLGNYKGFKAEYKTITVTDSDVENQLARVQKMNVHIKDLPDRPFEDGEMAIINFTGSLDGEKIDELSGVSLQVTIGSGTLPDYIEKEIIGKKVGDIIEWDIDYPEDFKNIPKVAGKRVHFVFEIIDGFYYNIPEIDDELVRSTTSYSSLAEYKEKEIVRLQQEADIKSQTDYENSIKQQLIDNCEFSEKVSDIAKMEYINRLRDESDVIATEFNMSVEDYYYLTAGISLEEHQKEVMNEVMLEIKSEYAFDEIAKTENMTVSQGEFDAAFNEKYIDNGTYSSKEAVYANLSKNSVDASLTQSILRDKAWKLVLDSSEKIES